MGRHAMSLAARLIMVIGLVVAGTATPAAALPQPVPHGHVYNAGSPRCLDAANPAAITLRTCSAAATQSWNGLAGNIRLPATHQCLDDGAGLNGSVVFLATCTTSAHQKWSGSATGSTYYNAGSGRCLDADTGTIGQNGTKVQVWDCVGLANQVWSFEITGD
ncbi:RICIN domain-containing protein [Hamadaea tsunoensis]|uniref:RICIN domain-containing protein n=1 Tax=Hamadaea tsunoensis TaxID=53368 RepID=UPI00041D9874|nr:RICIN domain-containing protein [Hamadaea tsunoensis]